MFNVQTQGIGILPLNVVIPGIHDEEIVIKDEKGVELFKKPCSKAEADKFFQTQGESVGGSGLLLGIFVPIRTDGIINFAKDLCLPSFFNIALDINRFIPKIIAGIAALFFDVVTFKIRLITAPSRLIYNYFHSKEHSLVSYVKKEQTQMSLFQDNLPAIKAAVKKGSFEIVFRYREVQISQLGLGGIGDTATNTIFEKGKLVITKKNLKTRYRTYESTAATQKLSVSSHPLFTGHFWTITSQSNTPYISSASAGESF